MSLPLEKDAEWKKLATGEKVSGGVCVGTDSGLFVVGGTSDSDSYTGLQKFTYGDGKWSTVALPNPVTKNLKYHGAAYLKSTDRIFVYAGSKDGTQTATSEGWVIGASEPHTVLAAGPTVPATNPILIPWSNTDVCFVGGSDSNTAVSWYNPDGGWRLSGTTLSEPIPSSMRAVLVPGDDGSVSLYVFDLTASPNKVRRHLIWTADNKPVTVSEALTKRDGSENGWPVYNATLAPKEARSNDYTVAQDSNGKVVFVGGSDKLPVAMFDGKENAWLDSVKVLGSESQKKLLAETTSSSKTSATKTSTSTKSTSTVTSSTESSTSDSSTSDSSTFVTSTATATDSSTGSWTLSESSTATSTDIVPVGGATQSGNPGLNSSAILGITLGTILGFLAVLIVVLLLLRRRKQTRQPSPEAAHARHNYPSDEKDPMAFENSQFSPNSAHFRGHNPQLSQESYSSMAILMGRAGKNKTSITRKPSSGTNRSSVGSLHTKLKATISKPILQEMQHPVLQGQDTRGVAFDPTVAEPRPRNGPLETQDGMRRSSGWNRYWSGGSALQILGFGAPKRNTVGSDSESHYSDSTAARNPRVTQDSATVPPLNFDFRPEMNRVNSGSPVVSEYSKIPFRDGVAGKIERPTSKASSGYSSGIPESINDTWDPDYKAKPWGADRAPSSVYNPSFYFGTPLSPSVPPPKNPPSGVSTQPQLAMASTSSDMSWLNLGDRRV